jgi:hypothetical protein
VSRRCAGSSCGGIMLDAVIGAFAQQVFYARKRPDFLRIPEKKLFDAQPRWNEPSAVCSKVRRFAMHLSQEWLQIRRAGGSMAVGRGISRSSCHKTKTKLPGRNAALAYSKSKGVPKPRCNSERMHVVVRVLPHRTPDPSQRCSRPSSLFVRWNPGCQLRSRHELPERRIRGDCK